jgi:hypothetical protein
MGGDIVLLNLSDAGVVESRRLNARDKTCCTWSDDGSQIAIGSNDGSVVVVSADVPQSLPPLTL